MFIYSNFITVSLNIAYDSCIINNSILETSFLFFTIKEEVSFY